MSAVGVGIIGVGCHQRHLPGEPVVVPGRRGAHRRRPAARPRPARRPRSTASPRSASAEDVLAHPGVELVVNLTIPAVPTSRSRARRSPPASTSGPRSRWAWTATAPPRCCARRRTPACGSAPPPTRCSARASRPHGARSQTGSSAVRCSRRRRSRRRDPTSGTRTPAFLFADGAGPLLDMGPYYFSALVSLLGPVDRVAAVGTKAREERQIHTGPNAGTTFVVEVPSTIQIITAFEQGAQAQSLLSFDSALERHGVVEIHGTEGTIVIPDPNQFTGRIAYVKPLGVIRDGMSFEQEWIEIAHEDVQVGPWSRRAGHGACDRRGAAARRLRRTRASTCSTSCSRRRSPPRPARRSSSRAPSRRCRCCPRASTPSPRRSEHRFTETAGPSATVPTDPRSRGVGGLAYGGRGPRQRGEPPRSRRSSISSAASWSTVASSSHCVCRPSEAAITRAATSVGSRSGRR